MGKAICKIRPSGSVCFSFLILGFKHETKYYHLKHTDFLQPQLQDLIYFLELYLTQDMLLCFLNHHIVSAILKYQLDFYLPVLLN